MPAELEEHNYNGFRPTPFWIVVCRDCLVSLNSGHHYTERTRRHAVALADAHNAEHHPPHVHTPPPPCETCGDPLGLCVPCGEPFLCDCPTLDGLRARVAATATPALIDGTAALAAAGRPLDAGERLFYAVASATLCRRLDLVPSTVARSDNPAATFRAAHAARAVAGRRVRRIDDDGAGTVGIVAGVDRHDENGDPETLLVRWPGTPDPAPVPFDELTAATGRIARGWCSRRPGDDYAPDDHDGSYDHARRPSCAGFVSDAEHGPS